MATKIRVIITAVLVFVVIFFVLQFFVPDKFVTRIFSKTGVLRVESIPKTSVFVDNFLIGQTPLQVNLPEGVHVVKLVPDAIDSSLITWSDSIKINNNVTTFVNRELAIKDLLSGGEILTLEKSSSEKGQILVSTDPANIFVSLDAEDRGISPMFMDNVNAGEHELAIRGEGLLPRSIKVNVINGYKLKLHMKAIIDEEFKKKKQAQKKATEKKAIEPLLEILDTPTGWLRVRSEPSLAASESAKVIPGEQYKYRNEENRWYEIELESDTYGWVYGDYIKIIEEQASE